MLAVVFAALLHAAPVSTVVPPTLAQSRANVERLIEQRAVLGLRPTQVQRLTDLSAAAALADATLRNSSKPWITAHAVLSPAQVEAQALAAVDAGQRTRAIELLRGGAVERR